MTTPSSDRTAFALRRPRPAAESAVFVGFARLLQLVALGQLVVLSISILVMNPIETGS